MWVGRLGDYYYFVFLCFILAGGEREEFSNLPVGAGERPPFARAECASGCRSVVGILTELFVHCYQARFTAITHEHTRD